MNIKFNQIDYNVDRISLIQSEGIRIPLKSEALVGLENAPTHDSNSICVAALPKDLYQVLVKPRNESTKQPTVYLLSKYILKKCQVDAVYASSAMRPERSEYNSDRPRYSDRRPEMDRQRY